MQALDAGLHLQQDLLVRRRYRRKLVRRVLLSDYSRVRKCPLSRTRRWRQLVHRAIGTSTDEAGHQSSRLTFRPSSQLNANRSMATNRTWFANHRELRNRSKQGLRFSFDRPTPVLGNRVRRFESCRGHKERCYSIRWRFPRPGARATGRWPQTPSVSTQIGALLGCDRRSGPSASGLGTLFESPTCHL
jgi:hypothetical protein